MKNIFVILLLGMIAFSGCKPTETTGDGETLSKKSVLKKMAENDIDYDWFSGKVRVNYKSKDEAVSATMQIKIEKDKKIWVSAQKFGFEGVRVLIEEDSIHILDRLKRTYTVSDFSYIQKELNLPANIQAVQDFIIGNSLKVGKSADYNIKTEALQILLIAVDQNFRATYALDKTTFNLRSLTVEDLGIDRKIIANQSDYQVIANKGDFSMARDFEVKVGVETEATVILSFSKVDFDEAQTMDFRVPSSYKVIR
jgi:outer membrane lipoprotein-sorting protein